MITRKDIIKKLISNSIESIEGYLTVIAILSVPFIPLTFAHLMNFSIQSTLILMFAMVLIFGVFATCIWVKERYEEAKWQLTCERMEGKK